MQKPTGVRWASGNRFTSVFGGMASAGAPPAPRISAPVVLGRKISRLGIVPLPATLLCSGHARESRQAEAMMSRLEEYANKYQCCRFERRDGIDRTRRN